MDAFFVELDDEEMEIAGRRWVQDALRDLYGEPKEGCRWQIAIEDTSRLIWFVVPLASQQPMQIGIAHTAQDAGKRETHRGVIEDVLRRTSDVMWRQQSRPVAVRIELSPDLKDMQELSTALSSEYPTTTIGVPWRRTLRELGFSYTLDLSPLLCRPDANDALRDKWRVSVSARGGGGARPARAVR